MVRRAVILATVGAVVLLAPATAAATDVSVRCVDADTCDLSVRALAGERNSIIVAPVEGNICGSSSPTLR